MFLRSLIRSTHILRPNTNVAFGNCRVNAIHSRSAGAALNASRKSEQSRDSFTQNCAAYKYAVAGVVILGLGMSNSNVAHARVEQCKKPLAIEGGDLKKQWTVHHELGAGAYGVVKLGKCDVTGELAAIKMIESSRCKPQMLRREINVLKRIQSLGGHKNIIQFKEVYVQGSKMCVVTELANGGELFEQIVNNGAYSEDEAAKLISDVGNAVRFLHKHGLIHKDLKPENLLLSQDASNEYNNELKIADFGSAGTSNDVVDLEEIGTTAYWSPELLSNGPCTSASDMWAIGCILYIMLSGAHPFDLEGTAPDEELIRRVKEAEVSFDHELWKHVSPLAKDTIKHLLEKDPTRRMTAEELMQHPWVKKYGNSK